MLVRIFKKSHWYSPLLLLLAAALLWMDAFISPGKAIDTIIGSGNALYNVLLPAIKSYPGLAVATTFFLLMLQVFMINHVATTKGFTDRYSALPGLIYLLLMSSTEGMIAPNPVILANAFLIPAVNKLLNVYEDEHVIKEVFNISFLIALASLFFLPALAFFLALLLSIFVYYIASFRAIFAAMAGLIAPYFFLSLYFFIQTGQVFLNFNYDAEIQPLAIFELDVNIYEQVFVVILSLLSFFSILRLQLAYRSTKPIRVRKRITMLIIILLFSVLSYVLAIDNIHVHYGMVMIALSIALSVFFYDIRYNKFTEVLFAIFMLLALAGRFSGYLLS